MILSTTRPHLHLLEFSADRVHGVRCRQVALVSLAQIFLTLVAVLASHVTMSNAVARTSVPILVNLVSWIVLSSSVVMPTLGLVLYQERFPYPELIGRFDSCFITSLPIISSDRLMPRMLHIAAACMAPYLLMSRSHEALFLISLCILMFFWIALEHQSLRFETA